MSRQIFLVNLKCIYIQYHINIQFLQNRTTFQTFDKIISYVSQRICYDNLYWNWQQLTTEIMSVTYWFCSSLVSSSALLIISIIETNYHLHVTSHLHPGQPCVQRFFMMTMVNIACLHTQRSIYFLSYIFLKPLFHRLIKTLAL